MSLIAAAPASRARAATAGEKVSASTGTPACAARPATAGTSRAASSSAGDRRAAAGGDGADVEQVEARVDQGEPVAHRLVGVPLRAPSKNESSVTLTIPAASGGPNSSVRPAICQVVTRRCLRP